MKTTRILSLAMTLAMGMIAGLWANVTDHQPPAPLPEFKTPERLAKWRSETTAKTANLESASSRPSTLDSSTPFYTGKPYLADSGSYAFKYREYNPEMGRWTTVDPSGFPDGANNRMYASAPSSALDPDGKSIFLYRKEININSYPLGVYHAYVEYNLTDCDNQNLNSTISGIPEHENILYYGHLISSPGHDKYSPKENGSSISYNSYGWKSEEGLLKDLLGAVATYNNNLFYNPYGSSASSGYNSNGFISGLLSCLGISNSYSNFENPGWNHPVAFNYSPQYKNYTCE
jgi:RHS repeat-associated protein